MKKNLSIKDFWKAELKGWKKHEIVGLSIVFLIILSNALIVKDSPIAVISAICGILYSTIAGKGKISCFFFGLCGTFCYSFLSFTNGLYGNLFLYMCYYFPMQLSGIFEWKKHLKQETREIIKKEMTIKQKLVLIVIAIISCSFAIMIIRYFNGSSPIFDGITTVLSIFGMLLTVKRYIEQWIIWMIVNGLSTIMWFELIMKGAKTYSTFIMWLVYFILAIYFYVCWKKEIRARK